MHTTDHANPRYVTMAAVRFRLLIDSLSVMDGPTGAACRRRVCDLIATAVIFCVTPEISSKHGGINLRVLNSGNRSGRSVQQSSLTRFQTRGDRFRVGQ